uniref:Uncharacterized protein n=1 Tax=Caenorhabditis japonica TaxID=281687 RepID=A0A8R1IGH3_CAEJA
MERSVVTDKIFSDESTFFSNVFNLDNAASVPMTSISFDDPEFPISLHNKVFLAKGNICTVSFFLRYFNIHDEVMVNVQDRCSTDIR